MMQQYMKELEQDPFDAEEFVERLAYRTIAETKNSEEDEDFNPSLLHDAFIQTIKDLTLLEERQQKKCERLEASVREDQLVFYKEVQALQDSNKNSVHTFQELDGKINTVATKVLHLGDQLDSVNGPRARVVEAQRLITHLNDFLMPGPLKSPLFTDPFRIEEAADVIQKLHLIAQDLPMSKFEETRKKIEATYDDIERKLLAEFCSAQRKDDFEGMKKIASVLSQFRGYIQCINAYIEHSQAGLLLNKDVFGNLLPLCKMNYTIIKEVFENPDQVMAKYVINLYNPKLEEFIAGRLSQKMDTNNYLKTLYDLYSKTNQLSSDLSSLNIGIDKNLLEKLTSNIFQKYIGNYIGLELRFLKERNSSNLRRYYESKNHQKKQIQSGGFQELRRDLQAVIGTRANINIVQIEDYGGETFLSEELSITILQDAKNAFQRCQLLSRQEEKASNAAQIVDCLLLSLLTEHVEYALELGLQAIPVTEGWKTPPTIYFFNVVNKTNIIIHLLEKLLSDLALPLVINTPKHNDCLQKKKFIMEDIERRINTGLDRSFNAIITWVRLYLQAEQKKTDYKPESEDIDTVASPACKAIVHYMSGIIALIKKNLDGKNVDLVLKELGIRLHKVIYDHMLQFQYSTIGAMIAICDLNEYRQCTKPMGELVSKLFDTLHALCNLLLVKPENLHQVCSEDTLVDLDRSIVNNFIQLRSDFKTQKQNILRV